jgi:hypothetical protein
VKRKRPEQTLQIAVTQFLGLAAPDDLFWTAINPIPHKSAIIAALCKAMGMRPGVADLLFIYRGRPLFIEMKALRGTESDNQKDARALAERAGAATSIGKSVEAVESRLRAHGVPLKATVIGALDPLPIASLARA